MKFLLYTGQNELEISTIVDSFKSPLPDVYTQHIVATMNEAF